MTLFFTIKIKRLSSPLHMLTSQSQTNYWPIFDNEQSYNHKIGRDLERAYDSPFHTSVQCSKIIVKSNSLPISLAFLKWRHTASWPLSGPLQYLAWQGAFGSRILVLPSLPPLLMVTGISYQANILHWNPCLRILFRLSHLGHSASGLLQWKKISTQGRTWQNCQINIERHVKLHLLTGTTRQKAIIHVYYFYFQ